MILCHKLGDFGRALALSTQMSQPTGEKEEGK